MRSETQRSSQGLRIVTWNCNRGKFERKAPLLASWPYDIAVIQECAKPPAEDSRALWIGDNPHQGISVLSVGEYELERLPTLRRVPKFVVPVAVRGPEPFTLFAVWSKFQTRFPYVEGIVRAVERYRDRFSAGPAVITGDFNSNAIWDAEHLPDRSHSALVAKLADLGLVSAYHEFAGEAHGRERTPTYFFQWKRERAYHIDYCFIPRQWARRLRSVEVGSYERWREYSDHRPLFVEVSRRRRTLVPQSGH